MIGALLALGLLAAFSVLASALPRLAAWPLAVSAVAYGFGRAWREWRSPPVALFFPGNELPVMLGGLPLDKAELRWRGPLAFLRWQDRQGRPMRLSWWPDTLSPASRRELRLAAGSLDAARNQRRMAP